MSAVSSTLGTHNPVRSEECAISLSLKTCRSNQGSRNQFKVRNLSSTHASLRSTTSIMLSWVQIAAYNLHLGLLGPEPSWLDTANNLVPPDSRR
jgi:hypothetical protein